MYKLIIIENHAYTQISIKQEITISTYLIFIPVILPIVLVLEKIISGDSILYLGVLIPLFYLFYRLYTNFFCQESVTFNENYFEYKNERNQVFREIYSTDSFFEIEFDTYIYTSGIYRSKQKCCNLIFISKIHDEKIKMLSVCSENLKRDGFIAEFTEIKELFNIELKKRIKNE